ncbi:1225_t:CDS:1 [Dentiscutata erythropus]|uniref:1225_t:CDS:1 n=1 Tax=Dentiscutata erythropus TaxID=1348616 RepID=A0A9N9EW66_9GLOM|nr:1225_t:CDS:1 [Dentiscutata erythropus]
MSKRAKLVVPVSKIFDISPGERTNNIKVSFDDDINNLNAVGLLNAVKADGTEINCTATVIKTNNGSVAITAAHCIYDHKLKKFNTKIYFYPGYNNGVEGRIGKVTAYKSFIWDKFLDNVEIYDYAFTKFYYKNGRKLQGDTGAFDYDLDIPHGNYSTTVFGYPVDGDMDCPRDGKHLCKWQGNSFDFPDNLPNATSYRGIPIDVGYGSSGGPWMRNYDPTTNTGTVMGISHGILNEPYPETDTAACLWYHDEFLSMLRLTEF